MRNRPMSLRLQLSNGVLRDVADAQPWGSRLHRIRAAVERAKAARHSSECSVEQYTGLWNLCKEESR